MTEVIKEMFHLYRNKSTFTTTLNSGAISNDSICFIEDTREIWTQGEFYAQRVFDQYTRTRVEELFRFLAGYVDPDPGQPFNPDPEYQKTTLKEVLASIKPSADKIDITIGGKTITLDKIGEYVPILDSTGKIPSKYLPSYVDDVLEFATKNDFPNPGENGKLYVATTGTYADTVWRWTGSTYIKVSGGSDEPITKEALDLGNVDNTADKDKPISTKQKEALDDKVDKVNGKGLSTNDFTNEYKNKLDNYKEPTDYSTTIENLQTTVNNLNNKLTWKIL